MTTSSEKYILSDEQIAENRTIQQQTRRNMEAAEQQILQENNRRQRDEIFQRESNNAQVLKEKQISEYREKLYATLGSADLPKTFKFIETFPPEIQGFLRYGEGLQLALQYDWSDNPQIENETRIRIMDWYDKNLREANVPSVKKPFFMIERGDLSKLSDEEVKFVLDQHILKGKLLYESLDNLLKATGNKFLQNSFIADLSPEEFEEAKLLNSRLSFLLDIASETNRDIEKFIMGITNKKLNEYVKKSVDDYNHYKYDIVIAAEYFRNRVIEHSKYLTSKR